MPVGWRSISVASMAASVSTGCERASDWKRFFAGPDSAADSTSVFQAPQSGHLPSHFGLVPPHSVQV